MNTKKQVFKILGKLIGIALFLAILSRVDLSKIWMILREANLLYILLMVVLVAPMLWIKSWRWRKILNQFSIRITQWTGLKLYSIGMFAGFVTPGQVGDLSKGYYLGKMGHNMGASLLSVILDRLFDLLVLALVALWGIEIFWRFMGGGVLAGLLIFLVALLSPLILIKKNWRDFLLDRLFRLTAGPSGKEDGLTREKPQVSFSPGIMDVLLMFSVTVIVYAIIFFRYYLLALAVGIHLSFACVTGAMALSSTLALLPISIANIGTRDALLIYLFSGFGISPEMTVAFSTLVLFSFLLNGIIGLISWFFSGIPNKGASYGPP